MAFQEFLDIFKVAKRIRCNLYILWVEVEVSLKIIKNVVWHFEEFLDIFRGFWVNI